MKLIDSLLAAGLVLTLALPASAEEIRSVEIGDAGIVYDYESLETGVSILTLNAVIDETNDSLRGLKNSDRRRLARLGQLIYQCRLMLYRPDRNSAPNVKDPVLVSRNYSLFTGVDLELGAGERMGIQVRALRAVDDASLFSPTLGDRDSGSGMWEIAGQSAAIDLRQFNINMLKESDLVETSDNFDIIVRFPVFQLEKPVNQWIYNFSLGDFRQAVRHVDRNCTPARLVELTAD